MRLFGLISTVDVIAEIRDSRLGDDYARAVAGSYAEPESVRGELEEARALMKRLGCFVVRTTARRSRRVPPRSLPTSKKFKRQEPAVPPAAPNKASLLD